MSKKPLEIDMCAGSQLRDTQGEMLSVEGADIDDLTNGNGRINDNHGKGFFNSIGRVTSARKIFKAEDCEDDRQRHYWEKVKSPYIYVKAVLYDDDDHPNAKAAAAILRNIHKADCPLKLKCSVEGGVLARGIKDEQLLARTKIHSVALTFSPANNATLVEPLGLEKTAGNWESDLNLIKSVMHLAKTDIPSFRHITRRASAEKIADNFRRANEMAREIGLTTVVPEFSPSELVKQAAEYKITQNVVKIQEMVKALSGEKKIKAHLPIMVHPTKSYKLEPEHPHSPTIYPDDGSDPMHEHTHAPTHHEYAKEYGAHYKPEVGVAHKALAHHYDGSKKLDAKELAGHKNTLKNHYDSLKKALTAGYGGAGSPTNLTGGGVLQSEHLDMGRGFKYIRCNNCGDEEVYMKHQVKCRKCGQSYPMSSLYPLLASDK